jgi:hypothetical protein
MLYTRSTKAVSPSSPRQGLTALLFRFRIGRQLNLCTQKLRTDGTPVWDVSLEQDRMIWIVSPSIAQMIRPLGSDYRSILSGHNGSGPKRDHKKREGYAVNA